VSPQTDTSAVSLGDYLAVVRRRLWLIIVCGLIAGLAAYGYATTRPASFSASATVLVRPLPDFASDQSSTTTAVSLATETKIVTSTVVADAARAKLDSSRDIEDLTSHVSVSTAADSRLLEISFSSSSSAEATTGAQAFADAYTAYRNDGLARDRDRINQDLEDRAAPIQAQLDAVSLHPVLSAAPSSKALIDQLDAIRSEQVRLMSTPIEIASVVTPADVARQGASTPNTAMIVLGGLMLGLVAGLFLGFLLERRDDTLRSLDQLESEARVPVLGQVPRVSRRAARAGLVLSTNPPDGVADAYRRLRATLTRAGQQRTIRTVLVVGTRRGEGTTTVAANLGVALALAGRSTSLVSTDLRSSDVARILGLSPQPGLADVLAGTASADDAVQRVPGLTGLRAITAGNDAASDPADLLAARAMELVLEREGQVSEFVIVEGSPGLEHADALTVSPLVDTVVLVAAEGVTLVRELAALRAQLAQLEVDVLGVVVNRATGPAYVATPLAPTSGRATSWPGASADDPNPTAVGVTAF
jgi:Mrp family chromosome partitioning ATPase/capsular polysaccharide biosynthesis protein